MLLAIKHGKINMIQSIRLQNFQSHLNSYLEFSPGINIITGSSNNGKTSLLRGIGWVITNRPQGLAFKSYFADKKDSCKVTLTINGQKIVREKNTNINQYQLNEGIFSTVGGDTPSEVSSAINLSEINTQSQFEKHFLITESPGEIGRTINKIVKLEDIDILISSLSSKISSASKEIELKKQDVDKLNISLEKFKDYDKIEVLVDQIVKNDIKIKDLEQKVKILNYISDEGVRVEKLILSLENSYDDLEEKINELEQAWLTYNTNVKIIQDLSKLVSTINVLDTKIQDAETILSGCNALQSIEENLIKYSVGLETLHELNNLIKDWGKYFEFIKKTEKTIEKDEVEKNRILQEYGCPLCGRKS